MGKFKIVANDDIKTWEIKFDIYNKSQSFSHVCCSICPVNLHFETSSLSIFIFDLSYLLIFYSSPRLHFFYILIFRS